jgi:hypothetical protein
VNKENTTTTVGPTFFDQKEDERRETRTRKFGGEKDTKIRATI